MADNIKKHDKTKNVIKVLDKLEEELLNIETDEIIKGYTEEDLVAKGLFSDVQDEESKDYRFSKKIEYKIFENYDSIHDVPADLVEKILKDIPEGTILATKSLFSIERKGYMFTEKEKNKMFPKEYLENCNVDILYKDNNLIFKSKVKGKMIVLKSLIYIIQSDIDAQCNLTITEDKLSVYADFFPPKGSGNDLSLVAVFNLIHEQGIVCGTNDAVIEKFVNNLKIKKQPYLKVLIAEGQKPISGIDGKIEYNFKVDDTNDEIKILPNGSVDYSKDAFIQMIKKDEVLAKIVQPVPGEDGIDVFGNKVEHTPGKNVNPLKCGENVNFRKDSDEYIAEITGQVCLEDDIINIFDNYIVEGDVDNKLGNINFNGNVIIQGNILPGLKVQAVGDVIVSKNVDSAVIEAGGEIKVKGGVIGGKDSIIKGAKNLIAHHLLNAKVEILGDVLIEDSCIQSEISCMGKIIEAVPQLF